MKTTKDVVFQVNQNNPGLHCGGGTKKDSQENANGTYLQNEELFSTGEDSQEIKEAFLRQWLYNVLDGISALVKEFPIYAEIPDDLLPRQSQNPLAAYIHQDSCGPRGNSVEDVLGDLYHSTKTNYEDGTWMTVRIRIPRTILNREYPPTIVRQSSDGNIHGQTGTSTGTSSFHRNGDKCDENLHRNNTWDNSRND